MHKLTKSLSFAIHIWFKCFKSSFDHGPKDNSSRCHIYKLKHRWPRPPPSSEELCYLLCLCVRLFFSLRCLKPLVKIVQALGGAVLPCLFTVLPQRGYGTTALPARQYLFTTAGRAVLPLGERYYRASGTTAMTAVLPHLSKRVGVISRQGEFHLPHTHSLLTPTSSLSLAQERRRRTSPDLLPQPLPSHSDRWDRSPPRPLAMDAGFSPFPLLLLPCMCF